MTLSEAFEALRGKYGSHSAAARALSINVSYYRDIRNGRAKLTNRMRMNPSMEHRADTILPQ